MENKEQKDSCRNIDLTTPETIEAMAGRAIELEAASSTDRLFQEMMGPNYGEELQNYFLKKPTEHMEEVEEGMEEREEEVEEIEEEGIEEIEEEEKSEEEEVIPAKAPKPQPIEPEELGMEEEEEESSVSTFGMAKEAGAEEERRMTRISEPVIIPELHEEPEEEEMAEEMEELEEEYVEATEERKLTFREMPIEEEFPIQEEEIEKEIPVTISPMKEKMFQEYEEVAERLMAAQKKNKQLNATILNLIQEKKINDIPVFGKMIPMEEYGTILRSVKESFQRRQLLQQDLEATVAQLQSTHRANEAVLEDTYSSLYKKILNAASRALFSETGHPIPMKIVEDFIAKDRQATATIRTMQETKIREKCLLQKAQDYLKSLVDLPDEESIIQYDKIRGELLSYQSHIESKNIKTKKFEKKVMNTLQIISHYREKEAYLRKLAAEHTHRLAQLKQKIDEQLSELSRLNHTKFSVECRLQILQPQMGLLAHKHLLRRFSHMSDQRDQILAEIKELRYQYAHLRPPSTPVPNIPPRILATAPNIKFSLK